MRSFDTGIQNTNKRVISDSTESSVFSNGESVRALASPKVDDSDSKRQRLLHLKQLEGGTTELQRTVLVSYDPSTCVSLCISLIRYTFL
jgi:hypothetical protein